MNAADVLSQPASRARAAAIAMAMLGLAASAMAQTPPAREGILLLAHGGGAAWNARIEALADDIDARQPTEVAFGMAARSAIQAGIDRLVARGVTSIVAVPLFISSHSSVITSTEYLLGLRAEAPAALAAFAKMQHGAGAHNAGEHAGHAAEEHEADGTMPVSAGVPIRMTSALDRHPIVADILASRARSISREPGREVVVLVAHGPSRDEENARWLGDMQALAQAMERQIPFRAVKYLTVRDDAPAPVRDAATAELREVVTKSAAEADRVLIVPLLLSFSGIEEGMRKRLEGLDYVMAAQGLAPDDRLADWVAEVSRPAAVAQE